MTEKIATALIPEERDGMHILWKLRKFSPIPHFFGKNFVKATVIQKKLLKSCFDEIFFPWERISCFFYSTVNNHLWIFLQIPWNLLFLRYIVYVVNWFHEIGILQVKVNLRDIHAYFKIDLTNFLSPPYSFRLF